LGTYLPHGTFLVVAPTLLRDHIAAAPSVLHVSKLLAHHKVVPEVFSRLDAPRVVTDEPEPRPSASKEDLVTFTIMVHLQRHAQIAASVPVTEYASGVAVALNHVDINCRVRVVNQERLAVDVPLAHANIVIELLSHLPGESLF
jgi:hypothetical protein